MSKLFGLAYVYVDTLKVASDLYKQSKDVQYINTKLNHWNLNTELVRVEVMKDDTIYCIETIYDAANEQVLKLDSKKSCSVSEYKSLIKKQYEADVVRLCLQN